MNKYGGINDMPNCDKRVYGLWFQMLRRCYDSEQQERPRGRTYIDCEVCERWKLLSCFAKDIKRLDGYNDWLTKKGYCLDKDTKVKGNRLYSKATCCFIPYSENVRDVHRRNPENIERLHEARKTKYLLEKDGKILIFDSEKEACEYMGVVKCSISSCYRRGRKCKGYRIAKMDGGAEDG